MLPKWLILVSKLKNLIVSTNSNLSQFFFATLAAFSCEAKILEVLHGQRGLYHHLPEGKRSLFEFLNPTTPGPFGFQQGFNGRGEFDGRENGRYQDGYNPYNQLAQQGYPGQNQGQYPQQGYPGQNPYGPYGTTPGFPFNLLPTPSPPPPPAPFPFNLIPTTPPPLPFPMNLIFPTTPRPFPFNLLG